MTSLRQVKAVLDHGRPNPLKHNIQQVISRGIHKKTRHIFQYSVFLCLGSFQNMQ